MIFIFIFLERDLAFTPKSEQLEARESYYIVVTGKDVFVGGRQQLDLSNDNLA